ncbi:MAG TPA: sulfotransferase domain-containing protein, partial [Flavobacteriales bacterium]|nr:sulfotransferase domain-containing protein [Flavobacteriales bacterium]
MVKYDFDPRKLLFKQYLRWLPAQLGLINKGAFILQIDEIRKTDIFFASYPKSGNTWLRYIMAAALRGSVDIGIDELKMVVPDVYIYKTKINTTPGLRYIKTHHALFNYYPRTVYIYRNVFDVVVSYYNHAFNKKLFKGSLKEFVHSDFRSRYFGSWASHAGAALEAKHKGSDLLILRYEDLLTNPEPHIASLLAYTRIQTRLTPAEIAAMTKFENLRDTENRMGSFFITGEKFFRKGM